MSEGYEIVLLVLFLVASATDLLWGKIYNGVTLSFLFSGVTYRLFNGGRTDATLAATAVVVAFVLFFPLWRFKALAAGDVKLLMAAGAWSTPKGILELGVLSIVIGAVVGIIVLVKQAGLRGSLISLREHAGPAAIKPKSHRMPFGPAVFSAFLLVHIAEHYRWAIL